MEKIKIENIELNGFKKFGKAELDLDKVTYIVARNGEGKSTILNAITWAIMGLDMFGNRMDPFQVGGSLTSWVKLDAICNGNPTIIRRVIQQKGKGKTETIMSTKTDSIDKELFYSMVNPRYVQSLDPKGIKNVIAKAMKMPVSIMESGMDTTIAASAAKYDGEDSYEKILAVEEGIKTVSAEIKDDEKEILIYKGKIEGVNNILKLLEENGMEPDEDIAEVFNMTVDGAKVMIAAKETEINSKKEISKQLSAYRTAAYEALATEFNNSMTHVQIKLTENGKEVFIVTYDGKNVRACSNSEQLRAGLEMINALAEATDMEYPVLVDNAECILNIDVNDYPNIKQFVFALVADENLSTWDGTYLSDIENGTLMPRSREQLVPSVKLLDGWGSKAK
jgi:hypothetical protein